MSRKFFTCAGVMFLIAAVLTFVAVAAGAGVFSFLWGAACLLAGVVSFTVAAKTRQ